MKRTIIKIYRRREKGYFFYFIKKVEGKSLKGIEEYNEKNTLILYYIIYLLFLLLLEKKSRQECFFASFRNNHHISMTTIITRIYI